jgi:acyl-CoA thioester hydrolase
LISLLTIFYPHDKELIYVNMVAGVLQREPRGLQASPALPKSIAATRGGGQGTIVSSFSETYRGDVEAWECDVFGHMNIAFYGERFGDAAASLLARIIPNRAWRTMSLFTRYAAELQSGESISIRSGVLGISSNAKKAESLVRIGHELTGSDGKVATLAEHALVSRDARMRSNLKRKLDSAAETWNAEPFKPIQLPVGHGKLLSLRDRVKTWELDEHGQLSLWGHVRRVSTAITQLMNAAGMSAEYIHRERRGFSTFESRLALAPFQPGAGAEVAALSGFLRLGNSSAAMVHDLIEARSGERIARCYLAGVHFDLDRRRAAPMPETMRAQAGAWVMKTG